MYNYIIQLRFEFLKGQIRLHAKHLSCKNQQEQEQETYPLCEQVPMEEETAVGAEVLKKNLWEQKEMRKVKKRGNREAVMVGCAADCAKWVDMFYESQRLVPW